jgi:ABC transporter substrate binding protein (PQQ-dependent alcohol dehydrogenase system)
MQTDAVVQYLIKKKWRNILLLEGPLPGDAAIAAALDRSAKRFGAHIVDTRPFLLTNDPRNRDQSNIALVTAGGGSDVVYVADSDGEFARFVPYQTNDPRPVVGSAGLSALAWHWSWEGNGAPQVNARFEEPAHRRMAAVDWAAFVARKCVVQSVVRSKSTEFEPVRDYLLGSDMNLDGTKGNPMSVRAWDHLLRQPRLLTTANAVIDRAPIDGFLHQTNELDTLGVDRPESTCRF